jgi:serine/threonine-protein kinase
MVTRDVRGGSGEGPADPGPPGPGDLFEGRYQIEALIGEGGFGAVHAARDTALDRDVALKLVGRAASDPTVLARFLLEAKAAASLASEHVATVYEVGLAVRRPYIVMERLRGRDLHDELEERKRIPVPEATELVLQAALGLAHAHARGIVHRDLKPRNLFLARRADGTQLVKILDFGIAKTGSLELTETGAAIGTTRYMAPEQLRSSRSVDARADIWALGVVLYELTTGSPIFDAPHSAEFGVQILSDPHVPPRTRVPELAAELERVIDRCLEKHADRRYGDLLVFARALGPLTTDAGRALIPRIEHTLRSTAETVQAARIGDGATTSHARGQLATRSPERARDRLLIAAALLVGLGGIAFGTVMWVRSNQIPASGSAVVTAAATPAEAGVTADAMRTAVMPPDAAPIAIVAPVDAAPIALPAVKAPATTAHRKSTKPTAAQIALIEEVCIEMDSAAGGAKMRAELVRRGQLGPTTIVDPKPRPPLFLVPGDNWCDELAALGCSQIIKGCASAPITDEEKLSCRDFLGRLRPKVCK